MNPIEHYHYESWNDFKTDLISELFPDGVFREGDYLFRGHRSSDWQLTSSYDRFQYPYEKFPSLLEMFKEECVWLNIEQTILDDEKYFIAFAQHHGIPTRLLDWTYIPILLLFLLIQTLCGKAR